ncbi:MAG: hypothetical protein Q9214_004902, partial [Letrouitia sp. 1 TL-2023]
MTTVLCVTTGYPGREIDIAKIIVAQTNLSAEEVSIPKLVAYICLMRIWAEQMASEELDQETKDQLEDCLEEAKDGMVFICNLNLFSTTRHRRESATINEVHQELHAIGAYITVKPSQNKDQLVELCQNGDERDVVCHAN